MKDFYLMLVHFKIIYIKQKSTLNFKFLPCNKKVITDL